MPTSYVLARTYAPASDFAERVSRMSPDAEAFCRAAGIPASTYTRMLRTGSASRRTAQRLACYYALIDGRVAPKVAFDMLFCPRPQVVMQMSAENGRYYRSSRPCKSA